MWLQEPWVSLEVVVGGSVALSVTPRVQGVLAPDKQTLYDLASLGPHSRPGCPAPVSPEDLAGLAWTLSPGAAVTGQRPHR